MALLDFQTENKKRIMSELNRFLKVQIVGNEGDGRTYTMEDLEDHFILVINNKDNSSTYAPLKNALYNLKKYIEMNNIHLSLGISINALFFGIDFTKDYVDTEGDIYIKAIQCLRKYKPVIIVLSYDSVNDLIKSRLDTLNLEESPKRFLRQKLYKINLVYLTTYNSHLNCIPRINVLRLSDSNQSKRDILKELQLNVNICDNLSQEEINFIFHFVKNNIGTLLKIINELNVQSVSFADGRDINNSIYQLIDNNYVDEYQRSAIEKILAYCAYSDNYILKENDLGYLLQINKVDFANFLNEAKNNMLIKQDNEGIKTFIALLNHIYQKRFSTTKGEIYLKLCSMIAEMYPSNYAQKMAYAQLANDPNVDIYFTQLCMQELREYRICTREIGKDKFKYHKLVEDYKRAQADLYYHNYSKIIELFANYEILPEPLNAEIKLIESQARTKSLQSVERVYALSTLNSINVSNLDGNLKYRVQMAKIAALIHTGDYKEARTLFDSCVHDIKQKVFEHPSKELEYILHTFYRKYNMIYNHISSVVCIEASKNYFKSREDLPQSYFFSLVNCLGIYLKNMDIEKAKLIIDDYYELKTTHSNAFNREYMIENNIIIYNFATGAPIETIKKDFQKLYESMQDCADKCLIASNYAVFIALSGDTEGAFKLLENNKESFLNDLEGIYDYRYLVNSAIFAYILDNSSRELQIETLQRITLDDYYANKYAMTNEVKLIINNMRLSCNSAAEWLDNYDKNLLSNRLFKNGYELGFVITELFNWSDD